MDGQKARVALAIDMGEANEGTAMIIGQPSPNHTNHRDVRNASRRDLESARDLAARLFRKASRPDLADAALCGGGDDFPEVLAAAEILSVLGERLRRLEDALHFYGDLSSWEDDLPGGPLALHDRGEAARSVLAGNRPFYDRD